MQLNLFEDSQRQGKQELQEQFSPYCDLVRYKSSVNPDVDLAMLVKKPAKKAYALFATHGWHQSIAPFQQMESPQEGLEYLHVQVDMRGRAFSRGEPDCNALELMDVYDAVAEVRRRYADYLLDPDVIYFESGSGGGGNAFALAGKFPDLFAAVTALYGISDYADWYRRDEIGEFRDEMDVWIGFPPEENEEAYQARSGLSLVENLHSPIYIAHGETDERVPASHSRSYYQAALASGKEKLVKYYEMQGVGTRSHTGNAAPEQLVRLENESEGNRIANRRPVSLPKSGELLVGGFLVTKHFSVELSDMGKLARIKYDLDKKIIEFTKEPGCGHKITWF
ncbi:MAG: alpha/beta hydrolase family protein [Christensenellales bacterium]|jgi:pimeloyl-ACP methyl ester carboxylesterase